MAADLKLTLAAAPPGAIELSGLARFSVHALRDHLLDPLARAAGEIPWRAEAITPEWLSPILCDGVPGAAVTRVVAGGGSSGSSVRRQIDVAYNTAGAAARLPENLFVKMTPTILTRLTTGPSAAQEAKFFRHIRGGLRIEAPNHLHSAYDRHSGRSIHILENLTVTRNARFCSYRSKLSMVQLKDALDLLATLHGTFHDGPRLQGGLAWVPTYETFFEAVAQTGTQAGHDEATVVAAGVIPASVLARKDRIWALARAGLQAHRDAPRTLIHSDVHPGNWYLTGDGKPGLCDWQCIARGHWARDLAYALSTLMDVETRRAVEDELLNHYVRRLAVHGGPDVDRVEAQRAFASNCRPHC